MIRVTNNKKLNAADYDEVWAIVRKKGTLPAYMQQVKELSPSDDLLSKYLGWKKDGSLNKDKFENEYASEFLSEIDGNLKAAKKLDYLYQKDKEGKNIALCCFCPDESVCHRSVIAGLLQGVGCEVKTDLDADYSKYFDKYVELADERHREKEKEDTEKAVEIEKDNVQEAVEEHSEVYNDAYNAFLEIYKSKKCKTPVKKDKGINKVDAAKNIIKNQSGVDDKEKKGDMGE